MVRVAQQQRGGLLEYLPTCWYRQLVDQGFRSDYTTTKRDKTEKEKSRDVRVEEGLLTRGNLGYTFLSADGGDEEKCTETSPLALVLHK